MNAPIPVEPSVGLGKNLAEVDRLMKLLDGNHPTDYVTAGATAAQVNATCALVHAVRELTQAVRDLNERTPS